MKRLINTIILTIFLQVQLIPAHLVGAQLVPSLPAPGAALNMTDVFSPVIIRGITIHADNPLLFDFIIDSGDEALDTLALRDKSRDLVKYFLAALTVSENNMWVNLSPYEKNRIISAELGATTLGRDMLAQDYVLKQLSSSLLSPEKDLGQEFWGRIYQEAHEKFGATDIPMDTFNKIWIIPDKAEVVELGNRVFVVDSHLKVMHEADYFAMMENRNEKIENSFADKKPSSDLDLQSSIINEILIPAIEKEVNQGQHFAQLRQMYHSMVLATWYKKNLRQSLLGQVYANKNKTKGVDTGDPQITERIYQQYLQAFKQGVTNLIREEYDPQTQAMVPRKYFSGGTDFAQMAQVTVTRGRFTTNTLTSQEITDIIASLPLNIQQDLAQMSNNYNVTIQLQDFGLNYDQAMVADMQKNSLGYNNTLARKNMQALYKSGEFFVNRIIDLNVNMQLRQALTAYQSLAQNLLKGYLQSPDKNDVQLITGYLGSGDSRVYEKLIRSLTEYDEMQLVKAIILGGQSGQIAEQLNALPLDWQTDQIFDEFVKISDKQTDEAMTSRIKSAFAELEPTSKIVFLLNKLSLAGKLLILDKKLWDGIARIPEDRINILFKIADELRDQPRTNAHEVFHGFAKGTAERIFLSKLLSQHEGWKIEDLMEQIHFASLTPFEVTLLSNINKSLPYERRLSMLRESLEILNADRDKQAQEEYASFFLPDLILTIENYGAFKKSLAVSVLKTMAHKLYQAYLDFGENVDEVLTLLNDIEYQAYAILKEAYTVDEMKLIKVIILGSQQGEMAQKLASLPVEWPTVKMFEAFNKMLQGQSVEQIINEADIIQNIQEKAETESLTDEVSTEIKENIEKTQVYNVISDLKSRMSKDETDKMFSDITNDFNKIMRAVENEMDGRRTQESYAAETIQALLPGPSGYLTRTIKTLGLDEQEAEDIDEQKLRPEFVLLAVRIMMNSRITNEQQDELDEIQKNSNGRFKQVIIAFNEMIKKADQAMAVEQREAVDTVSDNYGGIDFNAELLDLQIRRDGNGIPLPIADQPINAMRIEGFLPIIIDIQPINSLPLLLGLSPDDDPFLVTKIN